MPKCENFIFECSWSYRDQNCCDIFEIQKTFYGFCYSFNSMTSFYKKIDHPRQSHGYGFRSGVTLEMKSDNLHNPPGSRKLCFLSF